MCKIDDFKTAKRDVVEAKTWAGKIGDKYYHESPEGLNAALQTVIKRHHAVLIEEAIGELERKAEAAAKLAVAEHAALLAEAGLEV